MWVFLPFSYSLCLVIAHTATSQCSCSPGLTVGTQTPAPPNYWWKHLLLHLFCLLLEANLMACSSWTLVETSQSTLCFLPTISLIVRPQNKCKRASLLLHLPAYCSVFLSLLPYAGEPDWEIH